MMQSQNTEGEHEGTCMHLYKKEKEQMNENNQSMFIYLKKKNLKSNRKHDTNIESNKIHMHCNTDLLIFLLMSNRLPHLMHHFG